MISTSGVGSEKVGEGGREQDIYSEGKFGVGELAQKLVLLSVTRLLARIFRNQECVLAKADGVEHPACCFFLGSTPWSSRGSVYQG